MKTKRQGNDIILTVPASFGIKENIDYVAVKGSNDSITFIKKENNIFEEPAEIKETLDVTPGFPEDKPIGREQI